MAFDLLLALAFIIAIALGIRPLYWANVVLLCMANLGLMYSYWCDLQNNACIKFEIDAEMAELKPRSQSSQTCVSVVSNFTSSNEFLMQPDD